uniref:EF-hand domain-containing protein n=1 Tax=Globodera pallida TaxID=36090 RepID=A0A183BIB7_GLOPA
MANWEHQLREMFAEQANGWTDKDMSGFIGREDLICMLLNANKHDHVDPVFKTHLRFLIGVLKNADLNGDTKINFQEFKQYIAQAVDESQGVPIPVEHLQPEMDKKDLVNGQ